MTGTNSAERYEAELVLEMARAINRGETGRAEMIRSMIRTSISERLAKNGPKNEQKDTGDNHERDISEAAPILKP